MTLPSGRRGPWRATIVGGLVLLAAAVAGCATGVPAASRSSPDDVASASLVPSAAPSADARSSRSGSPTTTAEAIPSEIGDAPPAVTLTAEGGDPVTGQLGSYTWAGAGSEFGMAPWDAACRASR